ncbi:MAG: PH domain-containing protein [Bacteroidota bacterium]
MRTDVKIIQKAEFNPKIRLYMLTYVAFIMIISIIGIPLLIVWFLGLGQYVSGRFYENLKCNLTSRHLEFKKGVLFKVEKTIPLENIQDLTFIENPLLRFFDLRVLKIETAGQSNPQGSDMKLVGIVKTQDFRDKVLRQRELIKNENRMDTRPADTSDKEVVELLTEIKDILDDIRNKGNSSL